MADVICRWRNATPKTVCEFVQQLPHNPMSAEEFRSHMGTDFFHTAYQLACQLGLYYEDNNQYIPRFNHLITEDEARVYLEYWIQHYYAPNPFTKSLKGLEQPVYVVEELVNYLEKHNSSADLKKALTDIFHDPMGNMDIITNALNNYSKVISVKDGYAKLETNYKEYMKQMPNRNDKEAFFKNFDKNSHKKDSFEECLNKSYCHFTTAIKSKPFLLLAGISGTGKSRIVREFAFKSCPKYLQDKDGTTPGNYCMIEVKPNWHDSTELLGYYSRLGNKPGYQFTKFVKFLVKAKMYPNVPFFVCLDEMNLAPVEQYFAEILSILETRKVVIGENGNKTIKTEAIIDAEHFKALGKIGDFAPNFTDRDIYMRLFDIDTESDIDKEVAKRTDLTTEGLTLPDNVIIIGTVNMDDTTHQFSRKVIDRAMTIEMNGGNLRNMFGGSKNLEYLPEEEQEKWQNAFTRQYVTADEVLVAHSDVAEKLMDKLPSKLEQINLALKGTPFEVSYRVLNELTIMVGVMLDEGMELNDAIAQSVNNILLMKILPRIEGDAEMFALSREYKAKVNVSYDNRLEWLKDIAPDIKEPSADADSENDDSEEKTEIVKEHQQTAKEKIQEMIDRLNNQEFTRFWP